VVIILNLSLSPPPLLFGLDGVCTGTGCCCWKPPEKTGEGESIAGEFIALLGIGGRGNGGLGLWDCGCGSLSTVSLLLPLSPNIVENPPFFFLGVFSIAASLLRS
jgi:hypothetical protein